MFRHDRLTPARVAASAAALTCLAVLPASVLAQAYPNRQITVVVPFPAGGPSDVVTRIVTEHMARTLHQPIVIENAAGAGGTIGSARVAAAAPDGYRLLSGSMGSHVAAPVLVKNLKYNPLVDFEPVGLMLDAPAVIVARKTMPASNLKEFINYVKANGPKVTQGHGGVGASSHMACLLFSSASGVKPSVVPYRGSNLALNDVVAGQIDYLCDQTMGLTGHIKSGSVKAIVVSAPSRSPVLPGVPSSKEAGLPNYQLSIWTAMFAPKGTPADAIAALNAAIDKALEDAGTRKRLEELGGTIPAKTARSSASLGNLVKRESERWRPILTTAAASTAKK
jgi:tripartite-type tricarboxylate transporter receptor subunit TctC